MSLPRQFQISRSLRSAIASSSRPAPRSIRIHPLPTRPSEGIRSLHTQKGLAPPISPMTSRSSRTSNALRSASTFTSSGSSGPGGSSSGSFRSQMLKPTSILLVFVPIVCGFLGVWQVKRLRWKVALIDEVDRNLHKDPLVLPANINVDVLSEFSFRRVLLSGTPLPLPILLGPVVMDGVPGYNLILPFQRESSTGSEASTILLNRGFIPNARAAAIRAGALPPGFVTRTTTGEVVGEKIVVEGLLPRTGEKSSFTPDNNLQTNEWFWKDVPEMVQYVKDEAERQGVKLGRVQEVLVDVIERGEDPATYMMQQDIPIGRPEHIELRNQHAQYAVIWFSLSAATAAMLGFVLTKGRRGPSARTDKRLRI